MERNGGKRCTKCFLVCRTITKLNNHQCVGSQSVKCKKCPFKGKSRASVAVHHQRCHQNREAFKCDRCGYTCYNTRSLINHQSSHKRNEPSTSAMAQDLSMRENEPPQGSPAAAKSQDDVVQENVPPGETPASAQNKKLTIKKCLKCGVMQYWMKNHICGKEEFKCDLYQCVFMGASKKGLVKHRRSHMEYTFPSTEKVLVPFMVGPPLTKEGLIDLWTSSSDSDSS